MKRSGVLVKTNKGKGVVSDDNSWLETRVLVHMVDDDYNDLLDEHGKAIKYVMLKHNVEISGYVD
jgi:hypothetical protein